MSSLGKFTKVRRLNDSSSSPGSCVSEAETKKPVFVGILTVSDRCARGDYQDLSGPNLQKIIQEHTGFRAVIKVYKIVPDESDEIVETLVHWSDSLGLELIVTTGGTGPGPRDVTPEATAAVIEKETPGFTIAIITASLKVTKDAMLTRLKTGIRGKTLILNLPGSKKASSECLNVALPAIPHALECMRSSSDRVCMCAADDNYPKVTPKRRLTRDVATEVLAIGSTDQITPPPDDTNCSHHQGFKTPFPTLTGDEVASAGDIDEDSLLSSGIPTIDNNPRSSPEDSVINDGEDELCSPVTVNEAIELVSKITRVAGQEEVILMDALGRVVADDIRKKKVGTPVAITSGYALTGPVTRGEIRTLTSGVLVSGDNGQARQISIGSRLPKVATTVVALKDTSLLNGNKIYFLNDVQPGQGVRYIQTDSSADLLLEKGTRLGSAEISKLTVLGLKTCKAYRNPKIAVLSAGEAETEASNHIALLLFLRQYSMMTTDLGVVKNDEGELSTRIGDEIDKIDIFVITSTSEANRKASKSLIKKVFGATVHFGEIEMWPREASFFASTEHNGCQKLFFILPACPLGSILSVLLVAPARGNMLGLERNLNTVLKAKLPRERLLREVPEYIICKIRWRPQDPIPWVEDDDIVKTQQHSSCENAILVLPASSDQCTIIREGETTEVILVGNV